MKTSVLIPCIPEHFIWLNRVIYEYLSGTKSPFEIVVVLSDCEKVPLLYREAFQYHFADMPVKYYEYKELMWTGKALSTGEKFCEGDLISIQAADDLPSKNRIEVCERFFEKYDIACLHHSFFGKGHIDYYGIENLDTSVDYDKVKIIQPCQLYGHHFTNKNEMDVFAQFAGFPVTAGAMVYKRDIVGKFTWSNKKNGQDRITALRILKKFQKTIVIDSRIYFYFK